MFIKTHPSGIHSTPAGVAPFVCNTFGYKHANPLDLYSINWRTVKYYAQTLAIVVCRVKRARHVIANREERSGKQSGGKTHKSKEIASVVPPSQ
jgi:hypothetical protein